MRGCDANRTSRALADARRMIAGDSAAALRVDGARNVESRPTESRCRDSCAAPCTRQLSESGNAGTAGAGSCADPCDEANVTRAHRNDQWRHMLTGQGVNIRARRGRSGAVFASMGAAR